MNRDHSYEYEERAFFEEKDFPHIKDTLAKLAKSQKPDNKMSYFFVLPDVNVSIASSTAKTVVKYKGGQLGMGNGFVEHEFAIDPQGLPEALKLFSALLKLEPQVSEQFRINYDMGDGIEVALKYTHMWGFHLEFEKVYQAADEADKGRREDQARAELTKLAEQLGVRFIDDTTMAAFKEQCKQDINRGQYDPSAFRAKYGAEFSA
jgi:adenylate cyclase class IV